MRKKITTKKNTAGKKTSSKKRSMAKGRPAVKKKAVTKSAAKESVTSTILSKIKNVVDDTAAKIKTMLPTGITIDKESNQSKTE